MFKQLTKRLLKTQQLFHKHTITPILKLSSTLQVKHTPIHNLKLTPLIEPRNNNLRLPILLVTPTTMLNHIVILIQKKAIAEATILVT